METSEEKTVIKPDMTKIVQVELLKGDDQEVTNYEDDHSSSEYHLPRL